MSLRRLLFVAVTPFAFGCAAGEPAEPLNRGLDLAAEARFSIDAELIVEVSDRGRPIVADTVWLWDGSMEAVDADCMIHQGLGRCGTWFAEMEAHGPITVFAEVCGALYSQPLAFAVGPSVDSFTFSSQITVEADAGACGRELPSACDEYGDGPALDVTTVDGRGVPLAVRDVIVQVFQGDAAAADCLDGTSARGCTEWASQHTTTGRYRATVEHCGTTFRSDWIAVASDDSGCKVIPQSIELEIDTSMCKFGA